MIWQSLVCSVSIATNVIAALRSCCIWNRTLHFNTIFMEEEILILEEPQHDAKLPVSSELNCGKEKCTCYNLEDAWDCTKKCEDPIW